MNEREDRYLKCETITGEWWYKDLKTGEDLPLYSTPIRGLEYDEKGLEIFNRWQDPTINDLQQQLDKYKLILKALHKYFTEHECYEIHEFLRNLENCTENDMVWLKRMAGDDNIA